MNNKIPLSLLESLVVFYTQGTLEAAALKLQSTQPTLTRQLKLLEEYFSEPLFIMQGRKKVFTPFATKLALTLLNRFHDINEIVHEFHISELSEDNVTLKIGGRFEILKKALSNRNLINPIDMIPMSSLEVRRAVESQSVDIAISQQNINTLRYVRKELFRDEIGVAIPKKFLERHANLKDAKNWMEVATKYPRAVYKSDDHQYKEFLHQSMTNSPKLICPDWIFLENCFHEGLYWGLLPSSYMRSGANYKFFSLKLKPQIFYLYYRKSLSGSQIIKSLL